MGEGVVPYTLTDHPLGGPSPLGSPRVSPLTVGTDTPFMGGDFANKFWPIFLLNVLEVYL